MAGQTTDHDEIRRWARGVDATPVQVKTRVHDGEPTQMSFVFGKLSEALSEDFEPISWDQFFALFEVLGLTLVYDVGRRYELLRKNDEPGMALDGAMH